MSIPKPITKLKLPPGVVLLARPVNRKNNFKCVRCTHEWQARKKGALPVRCPGCSSPAWNKARVKVNRRGANGPEYGCQQCGHKWHAVKTDGPPAICPKCRSYNWNETTSRK